MQIKSFQTIDIKALILYYLKLHSRCQYIAYLSNLMNPIDRICDFQEKQKKNEVYVSNNVYMSNSRSDKLPRFTIIGLYFT